MRRYWAILLLLLAMPVYAQDATEGGNVTQGGTNATIPTSFWAAIVGNLNGSYADTGSYISSQDTPNMTVFYNEPNGSYANLSGLGMILTRLPYLPGVGQIYSPVQSDFNETGMFSNFTVFSGVPYNATIEDPYDTFVGSWATATCQLGNISLTCPYIILEPNIAMGVLKFDNGTHVEPVFFGIILNQTGYDGSWYHFEYMVPALETYYFYIYGLDQPPYVEILTPLPVTYMAGGVPFSFNITDDIGVDSCWYVLDGTNHSMSDCVTNITLNPPPGVHTLTLYANDTIGQIGSDTVVFRVSRGKPPVKPPYTGGGGTGAPYYPPAEVPPEVPPPPPPSPQFNVTPVIWITVDYPEEGRADFTLASTVDLHTLECEITADFAKYTTIELESSTIAAGRAVGGTITVAMSPQEILDYNRGYNGQMECRGRDDTRYSAVANVYLVINKPFLEMENQSYEAGPGERFYSTAPIRNVGDGNATAVDISAEVRAPFEVTIDTLPGRLGPGQEGLVWFTISIPADAEEGLNAITINLFESGRQVGTGSINVMVRYPEAVPECRVPDLTWTVLILLLAVLSGIITFKRKVKEGERYEED